MNIHVETPRPSARSLSLPKMVTAALIRPDITCFPGPESRKFIGLRLIRVCLARTRESAQQKGRSGDPRGIRRGQAFNGIGEIRHPKEAAKAAVSKDARRTSRFLPGLAAKPVIRPRDALNGRRG